MIDDNLIAYYKGLTNSLGGTFYEHEDITWFYTGRRSLARFNGVVRVVATKKSPGKIASPILDTFKSQGLPFFWADCPPGAIPGLGDYLITNGIPLMVRGMPAMARSLDLLPVLNLPRGVEISTVQTPEDEAGWLKVHMEGFNEPAESRNDFRQYLRHTLTESLTSWKHFLACWQGEPCAISTLLCASQAAGIYHVTTLPAFRGRGFGRALTLAAMHAARELGYSVSVLFATQEGFPLYRKLGFETIVTADLYARNGE